LHVISKVIESSSPFETLIFDGDKSCNHTWQKTECIKCKAHKLYPFQVEAAQFIERANGRCGIFHEMGLGKSIITFAWLKFHSEALPALFVVKSGIKYQFSKEIVRVLGMGYVPQIIQTSKDYLLPGFKCYIVSYDMLRRMDLERLKKLGIKTAILDECQQIKNVDSSRTQNVRVLIRDIPHILPLSGTPWKNRGSELFPVLNILDPQKFYSYQSFLNRWVDYYWDGARQKVGGIRDIKRFREYTKDLLIRRERAEVMPELPLI